MSTRQIGMMSVSRRLAVLAGALLAATVLLWCGSARALADASLEVSSGSNTTVAAGGQLTYRVQLTNVGDTPIENTDETRLTVTLPEGMEGVSADVSAFENAEPGSFACPGVAGAQVITCSGTPRLGAKSGVDFTLTLTVAPDATGVLTSAFELESDGAPLAAHTVDPVTVSAAPPPFGVDAFDAAVMKGGAPLTQAGAHPDAQTTALDFNTATDPSPVIGEAATVEDTKDVIVDLPPGLVGNPSGLSQCTLGQLARGELSPTPLCPVSSQVGTARVRSGGATLTTVPLFNMVPPPTAPARFAFNVSGAIVALDAHLRSGGDYGLAVTASNVAQSLMISGSTVTFWGVPFDPGHTPERGCPGSNYPSIGGSTCESSAPPAPFFRNPTACSAPGTLTTSMRMDSWQHPGVFKTAQFSSHGLPGYPYPEAEGPAGNMTRVWGDPLGIDGCEDVPFEPTVDASLTTNRADAPTGLTVDIGLPSDCWDPKTTAAEAEAGLCQSDMREAEVALPQGLSINPSAAGGREACSPSQIGLSTPVGSSPVHFNEAPASCPEASRIGSAEIETPLLGLHDINGKPVTDSEGKPVPEPLKGSVYLAQQSQNPFGSLLAMYLVVEGSGVRIKQAGEIELTPDGIITRFKETPQTPFSKIHVELFGGPRATLRTPSTCGTYTAIANLTPWSGNGAVQRQSSFGVSQACGGGFDPKLAAGTQNPLAGSFSPFHLRLSREDGSAELGGLRLGLPPGLVASLKDIPYCPDSTLGVISSALGSGQGEINAPRCPKGSQVGTVTAGAGSGPTPFYSNTGRAYWSGPYKGAPVSLAVVVPAVAGPFDLGSVVVRNRFEVEPETAKITAVSDPFPTALYGIPLDLRDVRLSLDRPDYTLNPTSCEPLAFDGVINSSTGQSANRNVHFQAAGCDRLRFKPKLSFRLRGKTNRGAHPALTAIVTMPKGANLAGASVALPHSEFLDQSHIGTVCTRVQYAAGGGGGEQCPPKSIYGQARVYSPILGYYLQGPVFLRSSSHKLPDLVLGLKGPPSQPIQVDAVGRIDSTKGGGIRTNFESVPDVPVSKVVLKMKGAKKGLLQNSTNICNGTYRAQANLSAHNGALLEAQPEMKADCGSKARKGSKGKGKGAKGKAGSDRR